jgi:hypothetical protein
MIGIEPLAFRRSPSAPFCYNVLLPPSETKLTLELVLREKKIMGFASWKEGPWFFRANQLTWAFEDEDGNDCLREILADLLESEEVILEVEETIRGCLQDALEFHELLLEVEQEAIREELRTYAAFERFELALWRSWLAEHRAS